MALRTMRDSSCGTSGLICEGGTGVRFSTASITAPCDVAENAALPVTISNIKAPNAKMSLRASVGAPRTCSGAMYSGVPIQLPRAVSCVRVTGSSAGRESALAPSVAMPKSRSLASPRGR